MDLKPEELLVESWIPIYKTYIGVLHKQLARIRSTLFVLEHVARFPFDLFGEHPGPFWNLVRESLEMAVVVGLWRILFDKDNDSLTLRQLKNQVRNNARDDAARRSIDAELRSRDVNRRISQIEGTIRHLRNCLFAHLDRETVTNPPSNSSHSRLTFVDLRELAMAAHDLINVIGMGTSYMTLYPEYDPTVTIGGQPIKSDVESLFDDIAARSEDLRMPEAKPYEFQFYWKQRDPEQRAAFNEYRRKLGLPEVATDG